MWVAQLVDKAALALMAVVAFAGLVAWVRIYRKSRPLGYCPYVRRGYWVSPGWCADCREADPPCRMP